MSSPRYLTKSRYVTGLECPTKLFYTGKKDEYADQKFDDHFLAQLSKGGFQVGELAKRYFPGGVPVDTPNEEESIARTDELLTRENVTIFEAAFRFENLFVRVDVLEKTGNEINLIEVKAKSWPPSKSAGLVGVRGGINKDFRSKIADLAFQIHVVSNAHPEWNITPYFFFADKTSKCPTDGLHQKFRIRKEGRRRRCFVDGDLTAEDLDPKILCLVPADDACKKLMSEPDPYDGVRTFQEHIDFLAAHYERDEKITPRFHVGCHNCEFQKQPGDDSKLKDGRFKCWSEAMGWTLEQANRPNVLGIWAFLKKADLIADGKISLSELTEQDIGVKIDDVPGLSRSERQWKQVVMTRDGATDHWIDRDGLAAEMRGWTFPLHFIDFETSMPAIPFKKDRRPYEAIAFQFSHHVVEEDGSVDHRSEWLESGAGVFPNYDFIRALRDKIGDKGTIFRYAAHENSYLNHIWEQLMADESVGDRKELCEFIESISHSKDGQTKEWCGPRDMVDMFKLVQRHYYHPSTPNGSCSIKHILPAVLRSSTYLQEKYSRPIYGAADGIPSRNFRDWTWVVFENPADPSEIPNPKSEFPNLPGSPPYEGGVAAASADGVVLPSKPLDPYKLLPPLFTDASAKDLDLLLSEEDERGGIREGGAAMAAYMLLQFEDMTDYERESITSALKKYCELDTFAMVMIYEAWREWVA